MVSDLRRLMGHPRVGFVVWDAKWWYRVAVELLRMDENGGVTPDRLFDPGLPGWFEDPDGGRPSFVDLATNDSPQLTGALLSLGYSLGESATTSVAKQSPILHYFAFTSHKRHFGRFDHESSHSSHAHLLFCYHWDSLGSLFMLGW